MKPKSSIKERLHHLGSHCLLFFASIIVILAIAVVAIKASTPLLSKNRHSIQHWLSEKIGYPIQFSHLSAGWRGFEPIIKFENVIIENKQNQPLIKVKYFAIGFDLLHSLMTKSLRIGLVAIEGTKLKVEQLGKGNMQIYANTPLPIATINSNKKGHNDLLEKIFLINKIYLKNIEFEWLRYTSAKSQSLLVANVNLQMHNKGKEHRLWGTGQVLQENKASISFVGNLEGDISDRASLDAHAFFSLQNIKLKKWLGIFTIPKVKFQNGFLTGKAWLAIKNGQLISVQENARLNNLELLNIQNQHLLSLNSVLAHMSWKKQNKNWEITGANLSITKGHQAYNISDFYLGRSFYKNAMSPTYTTYISNIPIKLIKPVATFFESKPIANKLALLNDNGEVNSIYASYSSKTQFSAKANFNDVDISSPLKHTRVENLSGQLVVFPNMGELTLNNKNILVENNQIENEQIHLTQKDSNHIYWHIANNNINVHWPEIFIANKDFSVAGSLFVGFPIHDFSHAFVRANLKINPFKLSALKNYLPQPKKKNKHLFMFLHNAFYAGTASGNVAIQGSLKGFPYVNQPGEFVANVKLNNVTLLYKKNWPKIFNLNGRLAFNKQKLQIYGDTANYFNMPIKNIYAVIPNLEDKIKPNIRVKGKITTSLQIAQHFIDTTPLKHTLGKKLKILQFQGPATLALNMDFPLKPGNHKSTVSGTLNINNGKVFLPKWNLTFKNVTGALQFLPNELKASSLQAEFLGYPAKITIATLGKNTPKSITQIKLTSTVKGKAIYHFFPSQFTNEVIGHMPYTAILSLYNNGSKAGANTLRVKSNMKGLGVWLPKPMAKNRSLSKNFNLLFSFENNKESILTANIGNKIHYIGSFKSQDNHLAFDSGDLHFGKGKALMPKLPGLLIDGSIGYFSWKQWAPYILNSNQKHSKNKDKKILNKVNLNITQLNLFSYLFARSKVVAQSFVDGRNNGWEVSFKGPALAGSILVPENKALPIKANLTRLYLNSLERQKNLKSESKLSPINLPALSARISDFRYNTDVLGQLNLNEYPVNDGLVIKNFSIHSDVMSASMKGSWLEADGQQSSNVQGSVDAANVSDLLGSFGYAQAINANKLHAKFQLSWPNSILDPSFKSITGKVSLSTGTGVITNVGSKTNSQLATGQILTFLSLQSLQQKLMLNFNDLTTKGFAFDSLKGNFQLDNGVAITNDTKIKAIVANVSINGSIDAVSHRFNLFVQVVPNVTSSLPIIATLVGGPIAGVATWVANRIFAPSVNKMAASYFRLTGPWAKPKIKKIKRV